MVRGRLRWIFGFAAVVLADVAIAHSAFANDTGPAVSLPEPAPVSWTGVYAGGDVGGAFTNARFNRPTTADSDIGIGSIDPRPTYGAYGGFNYQLWPWLVVGVEADYTKLSDSTYRELGLSVDDLVAAKYVEAITGRLGFVLWPDTMVYGRVGPAWMRVQFFQGFSITPTEQTLPGIQAGLGIETLVTPNIALRAEASYTYADELLSLSQGLMTYRPSFLLFELGADFKLGPPPAGSGAPATAVAFNPRSGSGSPFVTASYAPNWTGLEAGGFMSANGNQVNFTDTQSFGTDGKLGPYTDFALGGGWFAGGNLQIDRFVVGLEVSDNYEAASFNTATGRGVSGTVYNFAKIDQVLALTGRLGWLATPSTLFYFKAGPATLRMNANPDYWAGSLSPNTLTPSNFSGYQAGVGVETYLTPNLSVRFEGLYSHTDTKIIINGTVPQEFTLQPSVVSALAGFALHL